MQFLELSGEIVQVTATSGSATKLIYSQTLHSLLGLDCDLKANINYQDQIWRSIASTDTLICDEISMMFAELPEKLNEIFTACAKGENQTKLFGRINVMLFSDLYQLPSVLTNITKIYLSKSTMGKVYTLHPDSKL